MPPYEFRNLCDILYVSGLVTLDDIPDEALYRFLHPVGGLLAIPGRTIFDIRLQRHSVRFREQQYY